MVSAKRSFRSTTMAVCGMGRPRGRRNRAVTANQSARPPTSDAIAAACTQLSQWARLSSTVEATKTAATTSNSPVARRLASTSRPARRCSVTDRGRAIGALFTRLPGERAGAVLWGISYQVVARNRASASENRIHADDVARGYGFHGALVPGVAVYGYASHALLEAMGPAWLAGGVTRIRFLAPCYDGDTLVVSVRAGDLEVIVGERTCVVGCASLPGGGRRSIDVPFIPAAPVPAPDERPPASDEVLAVGQVLGSVPLPTDRGLAADHLQQLGEPSPIYREEGIVHPAYLLQGANRVLTANVMLPAWLHVESEIGHYRTVGVGEELEVRGRIGAAFTRKGHRFVVLDVAWLAGEETVAAAHHTAIWQLAGR